MDPESRQRRSLRLRAYDYTQAGAYFVTICTKDRACLFGQITNDQMIVNDAGHIVASCWHEIPEHFPRVELDEFIVMPNHVHGIIFITDSVGATHASPLPKHPSGAKPHSLGAIIGAFKSAASKRLNAPQDQCTGDACVAPPQDNATLLPGKNIWQRGFHEHVIRSESSLHHIREYIANNPAQWALDRENPESTAGATHELPAHDESGESA